MRNPRLIQFTNDNVTENRYSISVEKLRTIHCTGVNENGTLEQVNHYYPFGVVHGEISLNASMQPYKYIGKELDRMYRLDLSDYDTLNFKYDNNKKNNDEKNR